jgi:DNA-binding YbaB/EbfC family protein
MVNMKKLMKQAQDMQSQMITTQKELESMVVEGNAGGGAVTAKLNGKKEILSLKIESDLLKEEKDMVEDMIIACINQAQTKIDKISKEKMDSISGGMPSGMPGF